MKEKRENSNNVRREMFELILDLEDIDIHETLDYTTRVRLLRKLINAAEEHNKMLIRNGAPVFMNSSTRRVARTNAEKESLRINSRAATNLVLRQPPPEGVKTAKDDLRYINYKIRGKKSFGERVLNLELNYNSDYLTTIVNTRGARYVFKDLGRAAADKNYDLTMNFKEDYTSMSESHKKDGSEAAESEIFDHFIYTHDDEYDTKTNAISLKMFLSSLQRLMDSTKAKSVSGLDVALIIIVLIEPFRFRFLREDFLVELLAFGIYEICGISNCVSKIVHYHTTASQFLHYKYKMWDANLVEETLAPITARIMLQEGKTEVEARKTSKMANPFLSDSVLGACDVSSRDNLHLLLGVSTYIPLDEIYDDAAFLDQEMKELANPKRAFLDEK